MDDTQTPLRKRPRPVVSCLRCREKKLRCDRLLPCENCTKASCAAKCTYGHSSPAPDQERPAEHALPRGKRSQPVEGSGTSEHEQLPRAVGVVEDLQRRVAKLEEALVSSRLLSTSSTAIDESGASCQSVNTVRSKSSSARQLGTLVVKGSRSRYHGQNDRITFLNQVHHLLCAVVLVWC